MRLILMSRHSGYVVSIPSLPSSPFLFFYGSQTLWYTVDLVTINLTFTFIGETSCQPVIDDFDLNVYKTLCLQGENVYISPL